MADHVRRIQRAYPQLYLACHVEHTTRRRGHGLSDRDASVLAHLDELSPVRAGTLAKHLGVGPVTEAIDHHLAARRADLAQPPERVWDAMVALADHVAARDKLPIAVELDEPPRVRVTRIIDDKLPFGGRWYYELEPTGAGTRLTITEAGFVKLPMFRIFTALAPNATKTKFLRELGGRLAVPVTVEPAQPSARVRR